MTATQFVSYRDRGFWAYDVALGIFLKHLIDAAEDREPVPEWLGTAIQDWRKVACISDFGLEFDASWSAEQLAVALDLVDRACAELAMRETIPADEVESWRVLEDLRLSTRGEKHFLTAPLIALGNAIRALLKGSLPQAPSDTAWLYGTQEAPTTMSMRRSDRIKS